MRLIVQKPWILSKSFMQRVFISLNDNIGVIYVQTALWMFSLIFPMCPCMLGMLWRQEHSTGGVTYGINVARCLYKIIGESKKPAYVQTTDIYVSQFPFQVLSTMMSTWKTEDNAYNSQSADDFGWFWTLSTFVFKIFFLSVNLVSFVTELSSNLQKNSTLSASNSKRQIMFRIRLYCSSVP